MLVKMTATGAEKATFYPPPSQSGLLFPEWLDWHLSHNPDYPFLVLVGDEGEHNVTLTWGEVLRASFRLSDKLRRELAGSCTTSSEGVRIGILSNTDGLTYCTLVLAVIRAGFIACPLSIRNSVPALQHLLRKMDCQHLFGSVPSTAGAATALQETTAQVLKPLSSIRLLPLPNCLELYPRLARWGTSYDPIADSRNTPILRSVRSYPEYEHVDRDSVMLYLHSSGSTSFPKPIPFSHKYWNWVCKSMYVSGTRNTGTRWGLMGLPVFHGLGVVVTLGAPAANGVISLMFKPSNPPTVPTSDTVLAACKRGGADLLMAVPSFFVEWSQSRSSTAYLAGLKAAMYCGGALPVETGNQLVAAGAKVANLYGSTEVGLMFKLGIENCAVDSWNYGELHPQIDAELIPEGSGLFRLVVADCDDHPIAVFNQPGRKAFDTNDLLEQHPTKKHLWKVVGRCDDQLMMANGEKTNPGPMEEIINGNPHVEAAIMFGRGRTQVGVAIEPADHIDIRNEEDLAKFRNLIWPDIERANAFAPQHSRIFKEFILVADSRRKPFVRTAKHTVSRNGVLQQYADEIDSLYDTTGRATSPSWAEPPLIWDEASLHSFVMRITTGVMRRGARTGPPIDERRDLFEQGCDSLQATYIRAAIMNALREAPKPEGKSDIAATLVPQNLVFMYPTVTRLVAYMAKSITGVTGTVGSHHAETALTINQMRAMTEKYGRTFPRLPSSPSSRRGGKIVLLTGSTGTLGTYLLQGLLLDDQVERVYTINRPSGKGTLHERQQRAFLDRGVDEYLLRSPKLHMVEADVASDQLGVSDGLMNELLASVTTIIHNAWRLDFNLTLTSFESNIKATRNLIDLALRARGPVPAHLIFTSSVGTVMKWQERRSVPEELLTDPRLATATGYTQSKWVAEQVIAAAVHHAGLRATIWRVGQLAGSRQNGAWNTTDWLPLLVKSGERLRALPILPGYVGWLPTDSAAQTIIDAMHAYKTENALQYLHLVHPRPASWHNIMQSIAKKMGCQLASFSNWLDLLEEAAEIPDEVERNPAIKLLDFYRSASVKKSRPSAELHQKEAMGLADIDTTNATAQSKTLKNLKPLGDADVQKWMDYWYNQGLFAGERS